MIFQFYYWHALNLTARGNFRLGYFWSIFMFLGLFHQTTSVLACALCYLKICKISRSLLRREVKSYFGCHAKRVSWPQNKDLLKGANKIKDVLLCVKDAGSHLDWHYFFYNNDSFSLFVKNSKWWSDILMFEKLPF